MAEAVRTCPECLMRVLPSADGRCPSCRLHTFTAESDQVAADALKARTARRVADVERGQVLFGRTWKLAALQWVLLLFFFGLGFAWPGTDPELDSGYRASRYIAGVLIVVVGFALLLTARELARWLDSERSAMWSLAAAVPGGNVVALLIFTKEVACELERRRREAKNA